MIMHKISKRHRRYRTQHKGLAMSEDSKDIVDNTETKSASQDKRGISCSGCTKSIPLIDSASAHQKNDDRLARIRQCALKKGRDFVLQIKHDDLIHACKKFSPKSGQIAENTRPLPNPVIRQRFEQAAQTPGNDFMAARAAANLYVVSVSSKKKTLYECRTAIDAIKNRDPLSGSMISGLFEDAIASPSLQNKKIRKDGDVALPIDPNQGFRW